jgi:tripartite-type tricarboxylate transporter receptor subunit TctC
VKERYAAIEAEPVGGSAAEFAAFVKKETVKWADVVKKSGAKLD